MQKIFYQSMLQHQKNAALDSKKGSSCLSRNTTWMKTQMTNRQNISSQQTGTTISG
jgi:hypothetical protein